jgi:hypothetical protein
MNEYVHATDPAAAGGCGPDNAPAGDRDPPRNEAPDRDSQSPKAAKTRRGRKGGGNPIFSVLFLGFSLAALIFALRDHPLRGRALLGTVADKVHLSALLSALRPGPGLLTAEPVSSYLSFSSREALAREAFALMEKRKSELIQTEKAREELEKERNAFAGEMDQRRDLLVKYSSVLDVARPEEKTAFFETTLRRRADLYLKLYERKKEMLQRERDRLKGEIRDLAAYMADLERPKSVPASPDLGVFFRKRAEQGLLNRLFFLIEREEYDKAVGTLETLLSLDRKGANRLQAGLLRKVLKVLEDYQERTAVLRKGGGLDELKMAYLREDYGRSRELADRLKDSLGADGYLLPVLAEFQDALERSERLSRDARDDLGTKEGLKSLSQKALALEKKGEREKALKIYQELLLFNLPADDREQILGKILTLVVASAKQDAKRQENTRASGYLEIAKLADREGREKEAVENYRKIILECPNSDYAGEALTRLLALSKAGGV